MGLSVSFFGTCEVDMWIEYNGGSSVPVCWEPKCWVLIYSAAPPMSPCSGPEYSRWEPPRPASPSVTLVYNPNAVYCVRVVDGTAVPPRRDNRLPCEIPEPCSAGSQPADLPGSANADFDSNLNPLWVEVCPQKIEQLPKAVVPAPLAERDVADAVLGVKIVKPERHVFPLRPGIGRGVHDDARLVPRRGARESGIGAAPPARAANAAGVPLGTAVAGSALLGLAALTAAALRVLLRAPGAHRATRFST